jgi:hypothetical protein
MVEVLQSQLHFVRDIQSVPTAGLEPLTAIRDDSAGGLVEITIGMEQLRDVLNDEAVVGHRKRPRRPQPSRQVMGDEGWDPLQTASQEAGRYFVVRGDKS